MNKKQTIRTLGSIENKQTKQPKQPKQLKQSKKVKELLENDSDDNIEVNSEPEEEYIEPEVEQVLKPKKKRNITEEQKKVLVDRLAYARSLRKKESENKKF